MERLVMPYRVLLVDDAPAVREALRWALEDELDLVIVGEAGDGAEALRRGRRPPARPGHSRYRAAGYRWLRGGPRAQGGAAITAHPLSLRPRGRRRAVVRRAGRWDGFVEKGGAHPALLSEMRRVLACG